MYKKKLLLALWVISLGASGNDVKTAENTLSKTTVELLNNSSSLLTVLTVNSQNSSNQKLEPDASLCIPYETEIAENPIFSIKDGTKRYHIYYHNQIDCDYPSTITLDFATLKFIAQGQKNQTAWDEICIHNDTTYYDVAVSYPQDQKTDKSIKSYHKRNAIILEPGRTFHKNVFSEKGRATSSLGLLILSIAMAENKEIYSHYFKRRLYKDLSLVGNKCWNTVTLSTQTIKWLNNGFSVSCT